MAAATSNAPPGAVAAAVSGTGDAGAHAANMLMPQAYDVAWTDLRQPFNLGYAPGEDFVGSSPAAAAAASAAQGVTGAAGATTAGAVLNANPQRACLIVQNNSATGGPVLWFNFGQPAVPNAPGSFALLPGGSLVIAEPKACPKESVYIAWSGAGSAIGAYYQNSIPQAVQSTSSVTGWQANLGAIAWGYAPPPAPPAPPAPRSSGLTFVPINVA